MFELEVLNHIQFTMQMQQWWLLATNSFLSQSAQTCVLQNKCIPLGLSVGSPAPCPLRQAAPGSISRRLGALSSPLKTPLAFFVKSDPLLLLSHLDLVPTLCRTLCGPCAKARTKMEALFKPSCDAPPGPTGGGPLPSPTT